MARILLNKLRLLTYFTLTLQTYSEGKRARVRQMWLRTGSVRTKRTSPYVRSWPRRAQPQMVFYSASL
ncbi:MAG: hypothetical protein V3W07_05735, partial [Syntrophobacteria bacterium]